MTKVRGMTLLEVLVAVAIAGTVLFPVARFLYKSSWNQGGARRFHAERVLDSLMHSAARMGMSGDSATVQMHDATGDYVVTWRWSDHGGRQMHGSWKDRQGGPGRELWLERY